MGAWVVKAPSEAEWLYRDAKAVAAAKTSDQERERFEPWLKKSLEERAAVEFRLSEGDPDAVDELAWFDLALNEVVGNGEDALLRAAELIFDAEVIEE